MKFKSVFIFICLIICLLSIASVCASDVDDISLASEDTGQLDLSVNEEIIENNLQTSDENTQLQSYNDGTVSAENGLDVLSEGEGTYTNLKNEIGNGGNINLTKAYYRYNSTSDAGATTINIRTSGVIDGKGAVIDMAGSTIQTFYVSVSGVTIKNLTIKNANYNDKGGAIFFDGKGNVTNCNFVDNSAFRGGAIYMSSGNVTNCNFTNNKVTGEDSGGGAIYMSSGTVSNCNFTNNSATDYGGAIYFSSSGTTCEVKNCNFTDNSGSYGGAVYFWEDGTVSNCNFTDNHADNGGAIMIYSGSVENCTFTNNTASRDDGAIWMNSGTVSNCNFTNNSASSQGGAISFSGAGTVTNCNFVDNSASRGGAIFSNPWYTAADTCIFKGNSGEDVNIVIYPPALNVDNFTTFYGSGEKLTFDLRTNLTSIYVTNGNISISVYSKKNDSWVGNYSCLSGEGWAVDLPVGSYYAIFYTEYAKFQPINRTITITIPNIEYYINVTSLTTNNKTVNITAKSNIPNDILEGELLFLIPNSDPIIANYEGNGTWWAEYTFDGFTDYRISASYVGMDNVTVNNAIITITKANSTMILDNIVLNYGDSINVDVETDGTLGIKAMINGVDVGVINYAVPISGLKAGKYSLTVTTIPDENHTSVSKTVVITVNKAANPLKVKAKTVKVKFSKLKKKAQTLKVTQVVKFTKKGQGTLTYKKVKGNKKITINKKTGKVTIKKGLKKGTYKVKVKIKANGNANYNASAFKTVTFKIKIK